MSIFNKIDECLRLSQKLDIDLNQLFLKSLPESENKSLALILEDICSLNKPEINNGFDLIFNQIIDLKNFCDEFEVPISEFRVKELELIESSEEIIKSGFQHIKGDRNLQK